MDSAYGNDRNPLIEKSEFILFLFEQLVGAGNLSAKEKSILDRCTADVYRDYMRGGYKGQVPTLKDLYRQLMLQPEEEARGLALSSELFINGSLNTFAQETNVNTKSRIIDYDIRELGEQLMPLGMLVTLDSIFNRLIQNWKKGKTTWIFADEFYLLFRYEYSADFFYRLYKRIRKYSGFVTGLTQNVKELLKSDTARLMLANSEFLILLNQATTDRDELAALLNISDNQLSYITNVGAGHGLIRCSGNLVPFENSFPRNTKLYRLMTTKPESTEAEEQGTGVCKRENQKPRNSGSTDPGCPDSKSTAAKGGFRCRQNKRAEDPGSQGDTENPERAGDTRNQAVRHQRAGPEESSKRYCKAECHSSETAGNHPDQRETEEATGAENHAEAYHQDGSPVCED